MAQLGLPRAELSKHLRDGARLNPTYGEAPTEFPGQSTSDAVTAPAAVVGAEFGAVATLQEFVQLLGASGDLDNFRSPLVELGGCGESHGHEFGSFGLERKNKII